MTIWMTRRQPTAAVWSVQAILTKEYTSTHLGKIFFGQQYQCKVLY